MKQGMLHRTICTEIFLHISCVLLFKQFVFKTEAHGFRTVHEELAKGMNSDLKSNEQSAVKNILKVRQRSRLSLQYTPTRSGNLYQMCISHTCLFFFFLYFLPCPVFLVLTGNHCEVHGPASGRFR